MLLERVLSSYTNLNAISIQQVNCLQEQVSSLIGKTSDASKKVYSASMYIPNMALGLTGEVIVSAKELVFALTEVKF